MQEPTAASIPVRHCNRDNHKLHIHTLCSTRKVPKVNQFQKYICACRDYTSRLTTEPVQSSSLSLECIDDIKRCDCLPLSVLGVCDGVSDD